MENKDKQDKRESILPCNLDEQYSVSKTKEGIIFAFLLLIFSPIYGIKKYPKNTVARKTYLKANIITLVILIIVITIIAVVCVLFINLFAGVTEGATEAIIDGIVGGEKAK